MFQTALLLRETQKSVPKTERKKKKKKRLKAVLRMPLKLQHKRNFKKPEMRGYEEIGHRSRETDKEEFNSHFS